MNKSGGPVLWTGTSGSAWVRMISRERVNGHSAQLQNTAITAERREDWAHPPPLGERGSCAARSSRRLRRFPRQCRPRGSPPKMQCLKRAKELFAHLRELGVELDGGDQPRLQSRREHLQRVVAGDEQCTFRDQRLDEQVLAARVRVVE